MKIVSEPKTYAVFAVSASRKLIEELENDNANVIRITPLTTRKSDATFDRSAGVLSLYDWIIFPDVYAVEYFIEILNEREIDLFDLDALHVLACGEAVADRLRFVQLHADIITAPDEMNAVLSALSQYVGETEMANTSFFIPTAADYDSELQNRLIATGAKAASLPVYEINSGEKREITKLKALLKGGAIDEFIFTSPEDVFCLKNYIHPESLSEILSETSVAGTDEITIRALMENNLSASKFYPKKRG